MSKNTAYQYFTPFKKDIQNIPLPQKFTYPFYYEPHPLCIIATDEVQQHLLTQKEWEHDFGIDHVVNGTNIGKMFGVMVVKNKDGEIGYLAAFSGKLAETNLLPGFVPPIYDLLNKDGFFKKEEDNINEINRTIKTLENAEETIGIEREYRTTETAAKQELNTFKAYMKEAKQLRKSKRNELQDSLTHEQFEVLKENLKQESLKHQYDYKQLRNLWNEKLTVAKNKFEHQNQKIAHLKDQRKKRSAALQQKLFDQYQFLNYQGITKGVDAIFAPTTQKVPPAGAGDCAAPKLLQYAYQNQLKPIAMAEFWWGQSPKSEIRKHGYFYPSCRSKCQPILGHMLIGLAIDDNPIQSPTVNDDEIKTIYEDEDVVVVNKPAEFLSIPGKETENSVLFRMQKKYPEATGPLLVHRLDMSTSGLLLVAKNKNAHKILQKQFLDKTVQKRYVALLDGIIKADEGIIDLPLRVDLDDRPRQLVCYEYGKPAKTKFKVIERSNEKTRVHLFPITGRTHQLRVHAAHANGLNTPIVGDDLYGKKNTRLHLHAEYLQFRHPSTGETIKLKVKPDF